MERPGSYPTERLAGLVKAGGDVGFVFRMDTVFVFLVVLPSAMIAAWLGAALVLIPSYFVTLKKAHRQLGGSL